LLRSVRRTALPLVLCCAAGLCLTAAGTGTARATAIYSGTTDAAAIRLSVRDPNVVPLLAGGGTDVSSPQAQTTEDSFGRARALASLAYPGGDIAGLSTFLGVVLPPSVPVRELPPYPLTVVADQTTPHPDDLASPAYELSAAVDPGKASSTASGGASPLLHVGGDAIARGAVTTTSDGGLQATATTVTTGFQLPGLVSVASLTTTATASRTADGRLERHSSLDLTGASVDGLPLAIRDGRLVVPVLGTTLDVAQAIATLPALATLKEQGVAIALQAARATPAGVTAAGLEITLRRDVPAVPVPSVPLPQLFPQQPQVGPIPANTLTVVYTVGFADASATLDPLPDFAPPGPVGGPRPGAVTTGSPVGASPPGLAGASSTTAPPVVAADQTPAVAPLLRASRREPLDIAGLYLAIAFTALAALVLGQVLRRAGIRTGAPTS
jgi:hypothetical protein